VHSLMRPLMELADQILARGVRDERPSGDPADWSRVRPALRRARPRPVREPGGL
jgi:hypothetical protein